MSAVTPPPLQEPTSKEKKYDRQLRLWAASGQAALEESHVLLINTGTGVTGIEALKNLILPGIGQFTIQDVSLVTKSDLGVNFFLEEGSVGKFRAAETCRLLKELNPEVEGHYITEPVDTFIAKSEALKPFTVIVVASPIDPAILDKLAQHSLAGSIPLFSLHSIGFYSQFSVQLPSVFPIVDTHPDPASSVDLRILQPWPALRNLAERTTKGLQSLNDDDHSHIPYILLLLHYVEVWKAKNDGRLPQSYKEKSELRDMIREDERRSNADAGEENYQEAANSVLKALGSPSLKSDVKEVFEADECRNVTSKSANFWIIAHAIHYFYKDNGALPLSGSLPDMRARSADYITLQNIYKSKAKSDTEMVLSIVRKLEKQLDRSSEIPEKEVEEFCKNSASVKLIRGRNLRSVRPGDGIDWADQAKATASKLIDSNSLILIHIAFLAYDIFKISHLSDDLASSYRAPGSDTKSYNADIENMTGITHKIIADLIKQGNLSFTDSENDEKEIYEQSSMIVKELVRAGGAELHNIASLTGGLVAQEVIKVVTKQYVPIHNTCIFDGVESKSAVLRL